MQAVYETLSEKYEINAPTVIGSASKNGVIIYWGMTSAIMFIFNGIDALRRKKEITVRRSLGEGAGFIVLKNIAFDLVSYATIYIIGRLIIFSLVSGEFARETAFGIYLSGCLISLLPYLLFLIFDVRKAFSRDFQITLII